MATSITSNFWGDVVEELMVIAVTQNEIVENGGIYVSTDIQKNRAIPRVGMSQIIQPRAATPTPQGNFTFTERVLTPDDFMVYVEFNPNDFRDMWEKWAPSGDFVWTELNPSLQADLLKMLVEGEYGVNRYMGKAILQGDKTAGVAPYERFNGILKRIADDADVNDIAGAVALTSANIQAKLQLVYDASRIPVRDNPLFKYYLSTIDFEKYRESLVTTTYKSIDATQEAPRLYHGKNLFVLSDMPENNVFATLGSADRNSNIWLGVQGQADFSSIKVDITQNNSELWFFKMLMGADTQIKFGQDVVSYKP